MAFVQGSDLLFAMLRIRRTEEALAERYHQQTMRCPMHLCIGQEAIAVGICSTLANTDIVYSNHRAHGHYLAKGGDLKAMIDEILGYTTGCSGGRGGSMHLIDQRAGFMGSTPIVGGTVPIAVGAAWAARYRNTGQVVVVFFGDGCFEEGVLHESMNYAALKKLPVIFVCENNAYSVMTPMHERQPPERSIHGIAAAHGLPTWVGDGNDVVCIAEHANNAVDHVRQGQGPQFFELHTHRWVEHCGPDCDDHLGYRQTGELEQWKQQCPIQRLQSQLLSTGDINGADIQTMETEITAEINAAFADNERRPAVTSQEQNVYA